LLDYAEHLSTVDDRDGVRSFVAEARAIADPLRARPLIDRAERVLADSDVNKRPPGVKPDQAAVGLSR
jgi:hypothetical protein